MNLDAVVVTVANLELQQVVQEEWDGLMQLLQDTDVECRVLQKLHLQY